MNEEEIRQAQGFESDDARRAAGLRFVREVVETRGHPSGNIPKVERVHG